MSQPQWKKKYAPVKLDHRVAGWGENWNTSWGRNHHLVTILAGVSIQLKYIILVVKIGLFLGSTLQKSEPLTYYRSMLKNLNYPSWTLTFNTCYWYCFPLNQCIGTRIPGTQPSSWAADFFLGQPRLFGPSKGINEVSLVRKFHVGFEVWFKNQLHSNVLGWLSWLQRLPPLMFFCCFFTHQVSEFKFEITKFFFGEEKTYQEKTTDNI